MDRTGVTGNLRRFIDKGASIEDLPSDYLGFAAGEYLRSVSEIDKICTCEKTIAFLKNQWGKFAAISRDEQDKVLRYYRVNIYDFVHADFQPPSGSALPKDGPMFIGKRNHHPMPVVGEFYYYDINHIIDEAFFTENE